MASWEENDHETLRCIYGLGRVGRGDSRERTCCGIRRRPWRRRWFWRRRIWAVLAAASVVAAGSAAATWAWAASITASVSIAALSAGAWRRAASIAASALIAASITASPASINSTISTISDNRFFFRHRFGRFNRFNNFAFDPYFGGDWDYGYPYFADCGYSGYWSNPYCGYGYSNYAYSYPDYGYDNGYNGYDNGYANDYGYPSTGASGHYVAAPLATGRSVATGQLGSYCTISVKACELHHASNVGGSCSCRVPGGHARGFVSR